MRPEQAKAGPQEGFPCPTPQGGLPWPRKARGWRGRRGLGVSTGSDPARGVLFPKLHLFVGRMRVMTVIATAFYEN